MQIGLNLVGAAQVLVAEGILLPQLVAGPAITGDGREGTSISADTADTWTYDAAQAIVSAREYRLLIDGTQIVGPQGAASVSVPVGAVGGIFMMQLRVQVAAAAGVWSAWRIIAAGTVAGIPQLNTPTGAANGETGYTGTVITDTGAGTLYWAVTEAATPPDVSALKAAASQAVTTSGQQTVSGTGLTAETGYHIHFLQEDAGGYDSGLVSSATFTTNAAQATDPAAFAAGDWSISNLASGGDARVTVLALPDDGGDALKSIEYRIAAGAWAPLALAVTGTYDLLDLFIDGNATEVRLRATNLVGVGPDGAAKSVITTAAPVAPAAFAAGDWALNDAGTGGDAVLNVLALPGDGGSALTGLFVRIAGGSLMPLGGAGTGPHALDDLFTDGVASDVTLLAANAVGMGPESAPKSIVTSSPQAWTITDTGNGRFTLATAPAPVAAPGITNMSDGTFAVAA